MSKKNRVIPDIDMKGAFVDALKKLSPKAQLKNPVMLVVYIAALICSFNCHSSFEIQITFWLWATLLFSGFAESLAERKGKAQADSLKKSKTSTLAKVLQDDRDDGNSTKTEMMPASALKKGMIILCEAQDVIAADGEIIDGIASVDESAITGESAPVIREAGGDRSGVMAGTRVISDWIKIKVTAEVGESYLDKMILLIEGAKRSATPNEKALNVCLISLTIVFIVTTGTLKYFMDFVMAQSGVITPLSIVVWAALLVCLIPTTISGLLSAIGISGMERLLRKNVLAKSGRAVEAAGDVDVLLLDKTGTITHGARMAVELIPATNVSQEELVKWSVASSLEDPTPEGKSIIQLAIKQYQFDVNELNKNEMTFIPFTAETRMSGVDTATSSIRKGAVEAVTRLIWPNAVPPEILERTNYIARKGGTPLLVCVDAQVLGAIYLKDIVKSGIRERFAQMRRLGIRTVMVTGDNPLTAASIAAEAGVDDFIAEATPEAKMRRIIIEQENGHMVAMVGDGTNDAPALAQADIGVAMNSGTNAAKEAGNMVDLDSNPTKLLEIVEVGKELLMACGALTTFSIANDIAKYFTILPAIFAGLYIVDGKSVLSVLDILKLGSAESAILSAVIFNALVIVMLIPLAIRGVKNNGLTVDALLRRNIFLYGVGGIICPFIGIKIIDMVVSRFFL